MNNNNSLETHFRNYYTEFETYQADAINWNIDFRRVSRGTFLGFIQMINTNDIQLTKTWLSGTVLQRGLTPIGYVTFAIPARRHQKLIWLNKQLEDCMLLVFPKDYTIDCTSYNDFLMYIVSIRLEYIHRLIEEYEWKEDMKHLFKQGVAYNIDVRTYIKITSYIEALLKHISENKPTINSPTYYHNILQNLPEKILHLLTQDSSLIPNKKPRKSELALQKATRIILSNPYDEIRITDLCNEVGISERSLEYGFKDVYGINPKHFIKRMKLLYLRSDILEHKLPISKLARRYGFTHMGQLSADYKAEFGELPSMT